jgi:hypothetical protein
MGCGMGGEMGLLLWNGCSEWVVTLWNGSDCGVGHVLHVRFLRCCKGGVRLLSQWSKQRACHHARLERLSFGLKSNEARVPEILRGHE